MKDRHYWVNEKDVAKLKIRMPFASEANLIRAAIKAALRLTDDELRELCLETRVDVGRPKSEKEGQDNL